MSSLEQRLAAIADPAAGRTLGESGARIRAAIADGRAAVAITLGYPAAGWREALTQSV
jgi:ATP-binding protein involved in chromosome partitioning